MKAVAKKTMQAVAVERFGGPEVLGVKSLSVPEAGAEEILIRIESAGVGVWDPFEREGGFAEMFETKPSFPYVLGSEGAGIVEFVGSKVKPFRLYDRVYAVNLEHPKGGFYAEYAAVPWDRASLIPGKLSIEQAGALPVDGVTALQGLEDILEMQKKESILIYGASGGIGHLAVQLAKRMKLRVLAAASGPDGVELVRQLGADMVVDGHRDDVADACRQFAPDGVDAALFTCWGQREDEAMGALRNGGRAAYPNGVQPVPRSRPGVTLRGYDGEPSPEAFKRLNHFVEMGHFEVHIDREFLLDQAAEAQRAVSGHHLGKLILRPTEAGVQEESGRRKLRVAEPYRASKIHRRLQDTEGETEI